MGKTKPQNFRATEEQINQIKERAMKAGTTSTDFILKRVSADPVIEEKLDLILKKIGEK